MSNLKEALAQDFIFLHGDKKYSKEHHFMLVMRIAGLVMLKLLFLNMLFLFLIGKIQRNLLLSMIM